MDAYRKISIDNLQLKIQNAPIGERIQLRIYPDIKTGLAEIRCWYHEKLIDTINLKLSDLKLVHFSSLNDISKISLTISFIFYNICKDV